MNKWISEKHANKIAIVLQVICGLLALLAVVTIVLALLGRVQMVISAPGGVYERALLLESDHTVSSRAMFTTFKNTQMRLNTINSGGVVDFVTWFGVALISVGNILPAGLCWLLMNGFFKNIAQGKVFMEDNAKILQRSGQVLGISALVVPLLNGYGFPWMVNTFSSNQLYIGQNIDVTALLVAAILLVMAYVFSYGIYLQDEADHTL